MRRRLVSSVGAKIRFCGVFAERGIERALSHGSRPTEVTTLPAPERGTLAAQPPNGAHLSRSEVRRRGLYARDEQLDAIRY